MSGTGRSSAASQVRLPGHTVDLESGQLLTVEGNYVALRPRSFAVLRLLAGNIGRIVAKNELMSKVWPDVIVTEDSLTQCIADIRRAIGDRDHEVVRTVSRRGYILCAEKLSLEADATPSPEIAVQRVKSSMPAPAIGTSSSSASPPTFYAKSGDYYVAYQVSGDGPVDLVFIQGYVTHLEIEWENPWPARFYERLASFSRLIRFDKRGTGLSDRIGSLPTLEERMDDVRAVMDAVGSRRAVLLGSSEGGPMSLLFCATYPERVSSLILYGAMARSAWAPDNPWGRTDKELEDQLALQEKSWGSGSSVERFAPSVASIPGYRQWRGRLDRAAATPGSAVTLSRMNHGIDVRHLLPFINVPTLVMHRTGDRAVKVEHSRYLAAHIPNAKYLELSGDDHAPWVGDTEAICDGIRDFATGMPALPPPDMALTTILFADAVESSTDTQSSRKDQSPLGDWRLIARQELTQFRGREIESDGAKFIAVFDGPGRAVRCGQALVRATKALNLRVRASVHISEHDLWGDHLDTKAARVGASVVASASPGEVIVTGTVADLVAGSGLRFEPRGVHASKGIEGNWALFAAIP